MAQVPYHDDGLEMNTFHIHTLSIGQILSTIMALDNQKGQN